MSTPTTPFHSTSAARNSTEDAPQALAPLELIEGELEIAKKWMDAYKEAGKQERFSMLQKKILPGMFLLNRQLTGDAWKLRKSVSTTINIIVIHKLSEFQANKAMVSEPVPHIKYYCSSFSESKFVSQTSRVQHLQGRDCRDRRKESERGKAGRSTIHVDFSRSCYRVFIGTW
jgi:hypothetical protein